jgi:cation transport ATPase
MENNTDKYISEVYPVVGMQCAACSARIEKVLGRQQGVEACAVNLAACNLSVTFNPEVTSADRLAEVVANMGFQLVTKGGESATAELEERE